MGLPNILHGWTCSDRERDTENVKNFLFDTFASLNFQAPLLKRV